MAINKKFISAPFLVIRSVIKKSKWDNFVGGLIFGAIFSLVVNVVTVQIQESINKQRILEAVENEIISNVLQAKSVIEENEKAQKNKSGINNFHTIRKYSRDLWEQSTEPLQYIAQLDQQTQIKLAGYYTITIPIENAIQDKLNKVLDKMIDVCYDEFSIELKKEKQIACNKNYLDLRDGEAGSTGRTMLDEGLKVLKQFHPTADRLNDPILRLLMGSRSTRILSGH